MTIKPPSQKQVIWTCGHYFYAPRENGEAKVFYRCGKCPECRAVKGASK